MAQTWHQMAKLAYFLFSNILYLHRCGGGAGQHSGAGVEHGGGAEICSRQGWERGGRGDGQQGRQTWLLFQFIFFCVGPIKGLLDITPANLCVHHSGRESTHLCYTKMDEWTKMDENFFLRNSCMVTVYFTQSLWKWVLATAGNICLPYVVNFVISSLFSMSGMFKKSPWQPNDMVMDWKPQLICP